MLLSDNGPIVLGVTGGAASGKSTVVGFFVERGARSVSADGIARELLAPDSEMTLRVLAHFGPDFALSGNPAQVDRAKLARHIFADERARFELGALMHPAIHRLTQEYVAEARADPACRMVAVEIPLLYENGLQASVNLTLVTVCREEDQLRRLKDRNPGTDEADALRQIRAQMPITEKALMADFTIDTSGSLESVKQEAGKLYDRLVKPPAAN